MRKVAVTGLGAVTPIGNTAREFFDNACAGKNGVGFTDRFDTADFKVKISAQVKDFDPLPYMEKNEARRMDMYAQYAMAAAVMAMEDAGNPSVEPPRLGVYVGSGIGGFQTMMGEAAKISEKGPARVSPFFIPMMISNIAAGNIAMRFNAQGPILPVVSACATSTNALGEAYRAIKHGYADVIIAGGAEAAIVPLGVAGFTSCMALSTTNDPECASMPFDKRRDGFVIGEGAGVLILEEYEHAVSRGARIYALLTGYGNTCDAHHITAPRPDALCAGRCISDAMAEAGLDGSETLYINAHGTSTPLNDKTETLAIKNALGERAYATHISSTKSMTGHMLGAAGAVEAIAAVLALHTGRIPPTINYFEPDPECDLNYTPNTAIDVSLDAALSTSFGFGGHNACIAFVRSED